MVTNFILKIFFFFVQTLPWNIYIYICVCVCVCVKALSLILSTLKIWFTINHENHKLQQYIYINIYIYPLDIISERMVRNRTQKPVVVEINPCVTFYHSLYEYFQYQRSIKHKHTHTHIHKYIYIYIYIYIVKLRWSMVPQMLEEHRHKNP